MVSIEAYGAAIEEIPVDQGIGIRIVLSKEHVGHAQRQDGVGSGPDSHVFRRQGLCGGVVEDIDHDELRVRILALQLVVGRKTGAAPCGIGAPEHNQIGVAKVNAVVGVLGQAVDFC